MNKCPRCGKPGVPIVCQKYAGSKCPLHKDRMEAVKIVGEFFKSIVKRGDE